MIYSLRVVTSNKRVIFHGYKPNIQFFAQVIDLSGIKLHTFHNKSGPQNHNIKQIYLHVNKQKVFFFLLFIFAKFQIFEKSTLAPSTVTFFLTADGVMPTRLRNRYIIRDMTNTNTLSRQCVCDHTDVIMITLVCVSEKFEMLK